MPFATHKFGGVNNIQDPATLGEVESPRAPVLTELVSAENIDLGDREEAAVREGYALAYSGAPHSGWNTRDYSRAFLVEAAKLKQFFSNGTSANLLTLSNNDPCVFEEVNEIVVFTNNTDIGYISPEGAAFFSAPSEQFKKSMPAGQNLAFYGGRLWVAYKNTLVRSDAYDIEARDERLSDIPLPGHIHMVAAVRGGLWVSAGETTAFLPEGDAAYKVVAPYAAIAGTDVPVPAGTLGAEEGEDAVIWRSTRGVCLGSANGTFVNISEDTTSLKPGRSGAAMLRQTEGQVHYISTARDTQAEFNRRTPLPDPVVSLP